jgi:hypothetical protein
MKVLVERRKSAERSLVTDVVAHLLERGTVPRVEIDLPRTPTKLGGEGRVVDQIPACGQSTKVGEGRDSNEAHTRMTPKLRDRLPVFAATAQNPDVPQVGELRFVQDSTKDSLRVAEHTVAGKRFIEHDIGTQGLALPPGECLPPQCTHNPARENARS